MNSLRPILLVEDDAVDVMTVLRCFKKLKISNEIVIANNGEEAIHLLLQRPQVIRPCLVLLDINMPKMNGLEFLQRFKTAPSLKKTPVVILTSSKEESDIEHCFNLGVAGYLLKPIEYTHFVDTIALLNNYWTRSELPQ